MLFRAEEREAILKWIEDPGNNSIQSAFNISWTDEKVQQLESSVLHGPRDTFCGALGAVCYY